MDVSTNCSSLTWIIRLILFLTWLQEVVPQDVTVESLSPQPACPNQYLVYNCHVEFPSVTITWTHPAFGSLTFTAGDVEVGSMMSSNDGRVVANLTMNEGTMVHRMVASTLTIQPPLNDLNGTTLTCEAFEAVHGITSGVDIILLAGKPSLPNNVHSATPDDTPSTTIAWDPPLYTGGIISKYRVRIPELNYSVEQNSTSRTHTIEATVGVLLNVPYEVEVTAINECEDESESASILVRIEASEPPLLASLRATVMCSTGNILKADLYWEYGTQVSSVYTPPTNAVTVSVDGPAPVNECSDVTPSDMRCTFNITKYGTYTVALTITNDIGTTPNENTFDFDPLSVDYSGLTLSDPPEVTITLSSLCVEPLNHFFVTVLFGTQRIGGMDCSFILGKTELFKNSRVVFVPLDPEVVTISTDGAADYEYCAKVTLNDEFFVVYRDEVESKDECFSAGAASGITLGSTLLLALPLGILIGCCGSKYRRQVTDSGRGKSKRQVGAIYEEPGPVEAAIPLSENLAYGHVQGQRRN